MKTKTILLAATIAFAGLLNSQTNSEEIETTKVRIKRVEKINGVETVHDTIIEIKAPMALEKLNDLNQQLDLQVPELNEQLHVQSTSELTKGTALTLDSLPKVRKIIVVTDKIHGTLPDSASVIDFEDEQIQNALKVAGVDNKTLKVDKSLVLNCDQEQTTGDKTIKKIIIISTIKLSDASKDELALLPSINSKASGILNIEYMQIIPSPNQGAFTLEFDLQEKGEAQIVILSPQGKTVYEESLANFKGHYSKAIQLESAAKGVYFIQVTQGDRRAVKKMILN